MAKPKIVIIDPSKKTETKYIDGTNMILGRLSTQVAKLALEGNKIIILNCEKIVKTGSKSQVVAEYLDMTQNIKGRHKGPHWPRRPDTLVRRTIKRMLPYKRERGKKALKNIEVYMGIPKEYADVKMIQFEVARLPRTKRFVTMGEFSEKIGSIGWK